MEVMIGHCGYRCDLCAARSDDPEVRARLVDGWRRIFGHENYTAENVRCDGCRADGRLADKSCRARPCARERGVDLCALCDDFPCDKVRPLIASKAGMLVRHPRVTREEYDLCMRQFDSQPWIVRAMVAAGRLPAWAAEPEPEDL
ncbi:MAG: DUF3795 domain-containing protein [Candidatus Krumholzibacteriota bacterium]|nr:DUF3795 domain-containing protein [Candidatus Krumholzibacteriota bacterium]